MKRKVFVSPSRTIDNLEEFKHYILAENPPQIIIGGLCFKFCHDDYISKTDFERVIVCKHLRDMFGNYINLYLEKPFHNVLEFGIHQGGSALFYASIFDEIKKLVAVDIIGSDPIVDKIIKENDLSERVKLYWETSQDSQKVLDIINNEFEDGIDVIIDDCSHRYDLTKKTFEMTFPLLKPGGLYCIEDWGWAHWGEILGIDSQFDSLPALTNLLFEIIAILATTWNNVVSNINIINGCLAVIERGPAEIPMPFDVDSLYKFRGKKIIKL